MKKYTLLGLLILIGLSSSKAQLNNYNVGDIAPDFTVVDLKGNTHTLYQYTDSGKYVLLDFFGYWCGSCVTKAPVIQKFYTKFGCNNYDVIVLGIEGDGTNEQLHLFDSLAELPEDSYPACSGLDGNGDAVQTLYGVAGFTTLVIIGPDRKIINENLFPSNSAPEIFAGFPENSIVGYACEPDNINEINLNEISIYPNPTTGILRFKTNPSPTTLAVHDVLGQRVGTWTIEKTTSEIDLSALRNGFYFVYFENQPSTMIKIIKY